MTTIIDTTPAAEYIETHGWIQGAMKHEGAVCITGALRECDLKPGDWLMARAVYRAQEHAEVWNDADGRTEDEVTEYLRTHPVTDENLEQVFGPNWETVVRLIRRVAAMTQAEGAARGAARGAAWGAARDAASDAAWGAAWDAARGAAWGAARDAARDAAWDAAWGAARDAARDAASDAARGAASAVAVRDLITEDEYQTLTARIRAGIGSDWEEGEL